MKADTVICRRAAAIWIICLLEAVILVLRRAARRCSEAAGAAFSIDIAF
jgi:hypothetical protein